MLVVLYSLVDKLMVAVALGRQEEQVSTEATIQVHNIPVPAQQVASPHPHSQTGSVEAVRP